MGWIARCSSQGGHAPGRQSPEVQWGVGTLCRPPHRPEEAVPLPTAASHPHGSPKKVGSF
eukprot:6693950-Pyramimonas_sp.AAC.1